jgi:hypothetical protein
MPKLRVNEPILGLNSYGISFRKSISESKVESDLSTPRQ